MPYWIKSPISLRAVLQNSINGFYSETNGCSPVFHQPNYDMEISFQLRFM